MEANIRSSGIATKVNRCGDKRCGGTHIWKIIALREEAYERDEGIRKMERICTERGGGGRRGNVR